MKISEIYEVVFTRIPKKICWKILCICVILDIIGTDFSDVLDKITVGNISDMYDTIRNIVPDIGRIAHFLLPFFIILTIYFLIAYFAKPILFVFLHTSMNIPLEDISGNIKKQYHLEKSNQMDQSNVLEQSRPLPNDIANVDGFAELLKTQSLKWRCAYYGIAHTPLIFRMGFKFGNSKNVMLLHRKRGERNSFFEELTHENECNNLNIDEPFHFVQSDELIVSISTTSEITEHNLEVFNYSKKHVVMFSSENKGYDAIMSYETATSFIQTITGRVGSLVEKYNIKTIHMVISSSVAFTFLLGQSFNNNRFPEVIVYHFEGGEYYWGINMRKSPQSAFVPTDACNM